MRTVLEVLSSVGLITTTSTSDSECVSEYTFSASGDERENQRMSTRIDLGLELL